MKEETAKRPLPPAALYGLQNLQRLDNDLSVSERHRALGFSNGSWQPGRSDSVCSCRSSWLSVQGHESAMGQTEKHSARAHVFRSSPKNGRWFSTPKTLRGSNVMEQAGQLITLLRLPKQGGSKFAAFGCALNPPLNPVAFSAMSHRPPAHGRKC
jgi:hypothetical protein